MTGKNTVNDAMDAATQNTTESRAESYCICRNTLRSNSAFHMCSYCKLYCSIQCIVAVSSIRHIWNIISLKNLPILYHWHDRAINLCTWMTTCRLSHSLTPTQLAKAHVLYVYIIQWIVSVALPGSRTVAIWVIGMNKKTLGAIPNGTTTYYSVTFCMLTEK